MPVKPVKSKPIDFFFVLRLTTQSKELYKQPREAAFFIPVLFHRACPGSPHPQSLFSAAAS